MKTSNMIHSLWTAFLENPREIRYKENQFFGSGCPVMGKNSLIAAIYAKSLSKNEELELYNRYLLS